MFWTLLILLGLPDCARAWDCMGLVREQVGACVDECYVTHEWARIGAECNEAQRLCERDRFFACFKGPLPQAWLCEPVASDGTLWCQAHVRSACVDFDYDNDGDVDLYDWSHWYPSQWSYLRG